MTRNHNAMGIKEKIKEKLREIRREVARVLAPPVQEQPVPVPVGVRKGLTLIELAIVLLVLGIIMGIVFASIGSTADDVQKGAVRLKVNSDANTVKILVSRYEREVGSLEDRTSLKVISQPNPDDPDSRPFASRKQVQDPWKNYYFIKKNEQGFNDICSYGKDGEEGGEGPDADFCITDERSWPAWLREKGQGDDGDDV